jgi:hypothetical protein
MPPALAGMIADQAAGAEARAEAKRRAFGLPDALWQELASRARTVDFAVSLTDDGLRLEVRTQPQRQAGGRTPFP